MRKHQSGAMLLEALIAILIFSLGILGVVGMQAAAVNASRDSKFRSEAGLLVNELVGEMRTGERVGTVLQTNFQGDGDQADATNVLTDGPAYTAWATRVGSFLPGTVDNPPQVTVATLGEVGPPRTSSEVNIVVRWRTPNETAVHSYSVTVQIAPEGLF